MVQTINKDMVARLVAQQEKQQRTKEQIIYFFAVACELMTKNGLCEEATNITKEHGF